MASIQVKATTDTPVWVPARKEYKSEVYEGGIVTKNEEESDKVTVRLDHDGKEVEFKDVDVQIKNPKVEADMTALYHINPAGILHNLKLRLCDENQPYTKMASVLVAVNPLHEVPEPDLPPHKLGNVPHQFSVAEMSFQQMTFSFERRRQIVNQLKNGGGKVPGQKTLSVDDVVMNQSVVISGESGAGKTEAAKRVIQHLIKRCQKEGVQNEVDEKLYAVSPILESFGNASTCHNHNSSRFGKFSKLHFEKNIEGGKGKSHWELVGATVETYLLEKSRVVVHGKGERTFHIFYQILKGASEEELKELGLYDNSTNDLRGFNIMRPSGQTTNELKTGDWDPRKHQKMIKGLRSIEMSEDKIHEILQCVSGILHLGNLIFENDANGKFADAAYILPKVQDDYKDGSDTAGQALNWAAKSFGVSEEELSKIFLEREVKCGMEMITTQLDLTNAQQARDAVAKAIFGKIFDWLVVVCNENLMSQYKGEQKLEDLPFIGVLDIFGFELFEKNGFEQLLINYTNESLQATFCRQVFIAEKELYASEGLLTDGDTFMAPSTDNMCTLLFEGYDKNVGLLKEIDSQSRAPKPSDEGMNRRLHTAFKGHPSWGKVHPKDIKMKFKVKHYAAEVEYTVDGFLERNSDKLPSNVATLFLKSKSEVMVDIFTEKADPKAKKAKSGGRRPKRQTSIVAGFGAQIKKLVDTLESTKCSFIRCVKPNPRMEYLGIGNHDWFDNDYVDAQLRCLSVPQTAAVLRSGLPTRIDYDAIFSSYSTALPKDALDAWKRSNKKDTRTFVCALFWSFQVPEEAYKLGLTKVFFRSGMIDLLDKILSEAAKWAEGDESPAKTEVVKRFKVYYARIRWRRAYAKVLATNKFLKLYKEAAERRRAAVKLQKNAKSFLLRATIYNRILAKNKARAEAERKAKEEARKKKEAEEREKAKQKSGKAFVMDKRAALESEAKRKKEKSEKEEKEGKSRKSYRRPPRKSAAASGKKGYRTPSGRVDPDLQALIKESQKRLEESNLKLQQDNEVLQSDIKSLKEDIQMLKNSMPFTQILTII